MSKNILFITWDGPQTSYMEGLFMPIFHEVSKTANVKFHIIQFTWADPEKIDEVKRVSRSLGIVYTAFPIFKKPVAGLGSLFTLFTSSGKIEKYIRENHIDVVMPRSTFPAFMVNRIKNPKFKIIFDADGLPLEERVDFAGLKKESRQYRWMKSIETKILKRADKVITRSQKSIDIHVKNIGEQYRNKFSVVYNGRNAEAFQYNEQSRKAFREQIEIQDQELLFVYCGSLGEQYCWAEMMAIFEAYQKRNPAKFLVLTGNKEFALGKLSAEQKKSVIVKSVPFQEIPFWLSGADVAFALRQPSFSMQGVAPIKLGEYLLMGLPTVASAKIGDTEKILQTIPYSILYDHDNELMTQKTVDWLLEMDDVDKEQIREQGLKWFSLEMSAKSYISALDDVIG